MLRMGTGFIGYGDVQIKDDKVFTDERLRGWRDHLFESYKEIHKRLEEEIDDSFPHGFFLSESLLKEVIIDATIGMRKITDSENNNVADPNAFKEASYLAYWWLRHKPVSVHYAPEVTLDDVVVRGDGEMSEEERARAREKMAWYLKHVNELVAVQAVCSYLFDFSKEVCRSREFSKVKKSNDCGFAFESFEEMKNEIVDDLTYYFAYRAIAPKMIEQVLEAYTFHPAWGLTGNHWDNGGAGR